jgi:hypothetical protein
MIPDAVVVSAAAGSMITLSANGRMFKSAMIYVFS